jgi:serine protease Do
MSVEPLNAERREALGLSADIDGVVVSNVSGGPAAEAGLSPGDLITRINRAPVTSIETFAEAVAQIESGRSVPLLVQRDNNQRFLALRIP